MHIAADATGSQTRQRLADSDPEPCFGLSNVCSLCQHGELIDRWRLNGFTVTQCAKCKFTFVRELISPDKLSTYYDSSDDPTYITEDNISNLQFYCNKLRTIIESKTKVGKILDIGCSSGIFLDVMSGWDCYGIEISPSYFVAKRKYGDKISRNTLHSGQWPSEYFDVITLLDSFDHMADPLAVLTTCRELLKPGGLIVIKVHDISSLFAKVSGRNYYALIPPFHLSYFSPNTLKLALKQRGFIPSANKYISHILFFRTIFYRLSRGNEAGLFGQIYKALEQSALGRVRIKKNVFDIMTMFAVAS